MVNALHMCHFKMHLSLLHIHQTGRALIGLVAVSYRIDFSLGRLGKGKF